MEHEHGTTPEVRADRPTPRIYAASLSDYNDGRLHGRWIDADQDAEALGESVTAMLASSEMPVAEEFAIHDYEGFGPVRLDEYESLESVSRVAHGISEHGEAFGHWISLNSSTDESTCDGFEDAYLGCFESLEAYAEQLLDDLGYDTALESAVPEFLQPYVKIDVEGFARDLEMSGDVATSEGQDGVYVFDMRG
jgi:antirestriction protein